MKFSYLIYFLVTRNAFAKLGSVTVSSNGEDGEGVRNLESSGNVFLKFKGNDGRPSRNYPLGLCEGDCDGDSECEGDLVCFQRRGGQSVPGCLGSDSHSTDYCIHPDNTNSPPQPNTSERFRLKLYWEEGYRWQDETTERKWCMMHHYDRQSRCWYGKISKSCRDDQVYVSKCSGSSRQKFQFVSLPNDEVLIKLGYENKCFQRYGREIYLESCDEGNSKQRWYAPNGDFDGSRFEISQLEDSSNCVTQDHHPKEAEVVELRSCRAVRGRNDETSYWNKY